MRELESGLAFEGLPEHKITSGSVLLVDDQENDSLLIKRAFERAGLGDLLQSVRSGFEAMSYLNGENPYHDREKYPLPVLVLLDIKMPAMDGFQVLNWIRSHPALGRLCVVMLTTSDEIRDVNKAYELGANSFLVKPLDFWNASDLYRSLQRILERTG